jgi:hypothetical protein
MILSDTPPQVLVHREGVELCECGPDELGRMWEEELRGHIWREDEADVTDFAVRWLFTASLWERTDGKAIVLLHYSH